MKKQYAWIVLALFSGYLSAGYAQTARGGGNFGAGIILGEPTGISLKLIAGDAHAFDLATGWNLRTNAFYIHADYLLTFYGLKLAGGSSIPLYTGLGAKLDITMENTEPVRMGIRIPFGFSYFTMNVPLELFLEIAAALLVFPETRPDFGGGLGIRFYF